MVSCSLRDSEQLVVTRQMAVHRMPSCRSCSLELCGGLRSWCFDRTCCRKTVDKMRKSPQDGWRWRTMIMCVVRERDLGPFLKYHHRLQVQTTSKSLIVDAKAAPSSACALIRPIPITLEVVVVSLIPRIVIFWGGVKEYS